jgi:DHA1 family multidrug resistance protein-like MFS transporter/DHA1 family quinolone resistance protein-like MFS transporter
MYSPIVPVFAKSELGADYSAIGLIGMANYLPYTFAPFFVGLLLDRINRSYVLAAGIGLNIVSISALSLTHNVPEVMLLRVIAGFAHALYWPSSEVIVAANTDHSGRVKGIAIFSGAWVAGFMTGPLIGNLILDHYDYRTLFNASAIMISAALAPALILRRHAAPAYSPRSVEQISYTARGRLVAKGVFAYPAVSAVILYYAVTFGVALAVYPAFMKSASVTDQQIELVFFVFGASRFATLWFANSIAKFGIAALVGAVLLTAAGMLISFLFNSVYSFAAALVFVGAATSIFYPVTFGIITKNAASSSIGSRLGMYETLFGAGWAAGPFAAGLTSDAFGASSPYLGFFVAGLALAGIVGFKRK